MNYACKLVQKMTLKGSQKWLNKCTLLQWSSCGPFKSPILKALWKATYRKVWAGCYRKWQVAGFVLQWTQDSYYQRQDCAGDGKEVGGCGWNRAGKRANWDLEEDGYHCSVPVHLIQDPFLGPIHLRGSMQTFTSNITGAGSSWPTWLGNIPFPRGGQKLPLGI